mgnify:CR=1 FL=1
MQYSIGASNVGIGHDGLSFIRLKSSTLGRSFFTGKNYFQVEIVDSWNNECYNYLVHFDIEINWRCYER